MQTAVQRCCVMGSTSLLSTRSVYAVFGAVLRSVTQLCKQRVNDKKETWLEQHCRATDHNSKLTEQQKYRLKADIRFWSCPFRK